MRKKISSLSEDRIMYEDISNIVELINKEILVKEVEKITGPLYTNADDCAAVTTKNKNRET